MSKPLDPSSVTVPLTFKLPRTTVEAMDSARGSLPRSEWLRRAIDSALGGSSPPPRALPIGGQDAAAGAGVEAREAPPVVELSTHGAAGESRPAPPLGEPESRSTHPSLAPVVVAPSRRQREACDPGKHPLSMKIGTACGACGEEKAWPK